MIDTGTKKYCAADGCTTKIPAESTYCRTHMPDNAGGSTVYVTNTGDTYSTTGGHRSSAGKKSTRKYCEHEGCTTLIPKSLAYCNEHSK